MSNELAMITAFMMAEKQKNRGIRKPLQQRRAEADAAMMGISRLPEGLAEEPANIDGIRAKWVRAANVHAVSTKTLLYYHGGGLFSGSIETYTSFAATLSEACGVRVLLINYRLAPEFKCPAAHEDAVAAYRWLIKKGIPAKDIVLGGDSAGGMLALSTLLTIRNNSEALPAAAVLLSPWLDILNFNTQTYRSRADADPMMDLESARRDSDFYFDTVEQRQAMASLEKDMKGLPPLLIQGGDCEVLLGEARLLAEKVKSAGVDVTLETWPGLWHVFQIMTNILPEAREAVGHIGEFVKKRLENN